METLNIFSSFKDDGIDKQENEQSVTSLRNEDHVTTGEGFARIGAAEVLCLEQNLNVEKSIRNSTENDMDVTIPGTTMTADAKRKEGVDLPPSFVQSEASQHNSDGELPRTPGTNAAGSSLGVPVHSETPTNQGTQNTGANLEGQMSDPGVGPSLEGAAREGHLTVPMITLGENTAGSSRLRPLSPNQVNTSNLPELPSSLLGSWQSLASITSTGRERETLGGPLKLLRNIENQPVS